MKKLNVLAFSLLTYTACLAQSTQTLSFKECIALALSNNVSVNKAKVNGQIAETAIKGSKAAFLPSLSASVAQNAAYSPFLTTDGTTSADKLTQSGSYGVSADLIVWQGGKLRNTLKAAQLDKERADLTITEAENELKEKIATLYIQTLYTQEALTVNETLLKDDEQLYLRSLEMLRNGQMSRSEVAQLKAQWENGKYDVVNTRTTIDNYLQQLKALLLLEHGTTLQIIPLSYEDEKLLEAIPGKEAVFAAAMQYRPEVKNAVLAGQQAALNTKIAKAGLKPTVSLTAELSDGHSTAYSRNFFNQLKSNLNTTVGLKVSIPISDRRVTKTNVETAQYNELITSLEAKDIEYTLYNTVENFWLDAINNRQKYLASKSSAESAEESYRLLEEKFKLGLNNIADLATGRITLLNAKQAMLQSKYLSLLNIALLKFYQGEPLDI